MGGSPRDVPDVLDSMRETFDLIDRSIDTQKGPVAVLNYGMAAEITKAEAFAAYTRNLYQTGDGDLIDDDDIYRMGMNYGKDPDMARVSSGTLYFYRYSRPEEGVEYPVYVGTQASTDDGRFNYVTSVENSMDGDLADVYYNATEKRYELPVQAQAVAIGSDFDLPPTLINTLAVPLDGYDGVINKSYFSSGTDGVGKDQFITVIQNSMQGVGGDLVGRLLSVLSDINPTGCDDMELVPSTDFSTFERLGYVNGKIGYDIYVISDSVAAWTDNGTADGGETSFSLDRCPALSVNYVAVDGVSVPFSLNVDTTPHYRGSPRANDTVTVTTPLQPGQTWEIQYFYYDVVYEANENLSGRQGIFQTDTLVRLANPIEVYVAGTISAFSTADTDDVLDDLRSFTEGYFRDPESPSNSLRTFTTYLDPYDYQVSAEQSVDGLSNFRITAFIRTDRAFMDIEALSFDGKTEYPTLSPLFDISVG
jgi:hypothetical protein